MKFQKEFKTISHAMEFISQNLHTIDSKYPARILQGASCERSEPIIVDFETVEGVTHIEGRPLYEERNWDELFD